MLEDIKSIILFEFNTMRMSSRIWILSAIFIGLGLLATTTYSISTKKFSTENIAVGNLSHLEKVEEDVIFCISKHLSDCGDVQSLKISDCNSVNSLGSCEQQNCQLFSQLKHIPVLNSVTYWVLLLVLPFLIVLICFDIIAIDTQHRTVSFSILRTSRASWFIGKVLAYTIFVWSLLLLLEIVTFLTGTIIIPGYELGQALTFSMRSLLIMLPISFCYVSIMSFLSSIVKAPFTSLLLGFGILLVFTIINALGGTDALTGFSGKLFRILSYICPNHYKNLPWAPGFVGLVKAQFTYLFFGIMWSTTGIFIFKHRDV